jgi:hypothetical protein
VVNKKVTIQEYDNDCLKQDSSYKLSRLNSKETTSILRNSGGKFGTKVMAHTANKEISEFKISAEDIRDLKGNIKSKGSTKNLSFSKDCSDIKFPRKYTTDMTLDSSHGIRASYKTTQLLIDNQIKRASKTSIIPLKQITKKFGEDNFILEEDSDDAADLDCVGPTKSCALDLNGKKRVSSILSKLGPKKTGENSDSNSD